MGKKTFKVFIEIGTHYDLYKKCDENINKALMNNLKKELFGIAIKNNDFSEYMAVKIYKEPYNEEAKELAIGYIVDRLYEEDDTRDIFIGGTRLPSAGENKEYSLRTAIFPYRNKAKEIYVRIQPFNLYLDMQECLDDERVLTFKIER